MKLKALLMLLWLPLTALAQTIPIEGVVVDAQNHRPLPFASVYVGPTASTITNAEGAFTIKCETSDVLRISYVGYKTLNIQAAQLSRQVELQPMETMLQEVTVMPIDLKKLIRKTTKEMRQQLRKYENRESNFFYRQITFSDTTCIELMEAFLNARSAVYLQDLSLLKGRFAGIQPDSLHRYSFYTNFFTESCLPMLTRYDSHDNKDSKPLTRNYKDFYHLDYDILGDGDERLIAVHFIPKEEIKKPILDVKLYIDPKTYHLRKMEGTNNNVSIVNRDYYVLKVDTVKTLKTVVSLESSTFNLTVNMTEERGFVEVQSVYIDEQHERYGKTHNTRSILFNIGDQLASKGSQIRPTGDLHQYIREQDYDLDFWNENEIVRRTPVEDAVVWLFESKQLFGVFK